MSEKKRKPRIGQMVYVVWNAVITPTVVGWLGKDSWVPEDFKDICSECQVMDYKNNYEKDPDYWPVYNPTWFFTLEEAKEELLRQEPDCKKIIFNRWFWEVEYE